MATSKKMDKAARRALADADDLILVESWRKGDESAYATIFKKYYNYVAHLCMMYVDDPWEAEDIAQEMFVMWYERKTLFTVRINLRMYMYRSVKFKCINQNLKQRAQRKRLAGYKMWFNPEQIRSDSRVILDHAEEWAIKIKKAMLILAPMERAVIEETYFRGSTGEMAAIKLEKSKQTIRNQVSGGLKKLRAAVK